jgi:DNA-binding NarL/FixJ family response regulator
MAAPVTPVRPQEDGAAGSAGLVLVVDDHADTRQMLHTALAAGGLTPILAENGERALALLDDAMPDLILLDAVMPEIDGFETCRRIKARPDRADVPVMFMTGLCDTAHVVEGLRAGGVDYITKPLVLDELLARIQVHLANSRMSRRALSALDAIGRKLIATDARGTVLWTTPPGAGLLAGMSIDALQAQIVRMIGAVEARGASSAFEQIAAHGTFQIACIGKTGPGEFLFRLKDSMAGRETLLLQQSLGLTPRESDVLHWTSMGKSNKDTSEILNISARTVNKHLEQIFIKLGVENRSAAASIATRLIAIHD